MFDYWIPPRAVIGKGDGSGGSGGGVATLKGKIAAAYDLTSGSTTTDAVAGNNLTNNGVTTFVAGGTPSGYGQFVTASSQYLSRATTPALEVAAGQSFMISAWVYLDNLITDNKVVVGKDLLGAREYNLYHGQVSNAFAFFVTTSTGLQQITNVSVTPVVSTWYHLLAWFDAGLQTVNLVINNGTLNSAAATGNAVVTTTEFNIGRIAYVGANQYMGGRITRVALGRFVPTAAEIAHLYNAGAGRLYSEITI